MFSTAMGIVSQQVRKLFLLQWVSPRQLNIYLGPGFRLRPHGMIQQENTTLAFRQNVIRKQGTLEHLREERIQVNPIKQCQPST